MRYFMTRINSQLYSRLFPFRSCNESQKKMIQTCHKTKKPIQLVHRTEAGLNKPETARVSVSISIAANTGYVSLGLTELQT